MTVTLEEQAMKRASPDAIRMELMDDGKHIAAALHLSGPDDKYLYWTKHALADLPNDLISVEDLERFGIDLIDVPAVR